MKKLFLISGLIGLAACATVNTTPNTIYMGNAKYVKNISATDTGKTSNGLMRVQISGDALLDTELYYSVVWFDESNMRIDTTLSKPIHASVRSGQPFTWNAVAPNKNASSYKVYVSNRMIEQ